MSKADELIEMMKELGELFKHPDVTEEARLETINNMIIFQTILMREMQKRISEKMALDVNIFNDLGRNDNYYDIACDMDIYHRYYSSKVELVKQSESLEKGIANKLK